MTRARRSAYSTGATDYSVEFSACQEIHAEFGHVASLSAPVLGGVGAFDQGCNTYSPNPGLTITACWTKSVALKVSAGDTIGTVGGSATSFALDFSFWDSRISPLVFANAARWSTTTDGFDRFHVAAGSDYYEATLRAQIAPHVGSFDGRTRRVALPIGGTIEIDVPGRAQGVWFNPSQPTFPETAHLAIGPDNVDPNLVVFSVGLSQPGFSGGQFRYSPTVAGTVNRDPATISPGATIYCFQTTGPVFLLQLVDASTLRLEVRPNASTCASQQPLAFVTGATFDYKR